MAGRVSFLLCLGAAVALHAGALMVFEPRLETAARDPGVRVSAAGASDEIAALVEAWNTPPDVGEADDLAEVDVEETPPDTEAAEVADAAVEADATADDLGEHTGPGKEAVRPIMAKLPTPKTSAPKQIALRSPEPQSFNLASLSTPEPSSPSFGAGLASPGGTVGGGLGSPAPAGSPSLGFTIPLEVEDEPTAPENAPLPVHGRTRRSLRGAKPIRLISRSSRCCSRTMHRRRRRRRHRRTPARTPNLLPRSEAVPSAARWADHRRWRRLAVRVEPWATVLAVACQEVRAPNPPPRRRYPGRSRRPR